MEGRKGSMVPEDREAMEARTAAKNFIQEGSREAFLEAMEFIEKLAGTGKAGSSGSFE